MNNEIQNANPLDDFLDEDTFTENPFGQTNGQDFDPFSATPAPVQNGQIAEAVQTAANPPAQQVILSLQQVDPPVEASEPAAPNQTAVQTQLSFASEPAAEPKKDDVVKLSTGENPLAAALKNAQANADQKIIETFATNLPKFSYAKVKEDITDNEKTFDNLREQYESDFPELSEKKRVSWTVTYGKVTKVIIKPEADKVYDIKAEIEKSKAFLDGIKKAKTDAERQPECLVTPKVTAQSKGEAMASYKGIFPTLGAALASDKLIMLVPSRDGKVYEIRKTDIGKFITPAACPPELSLIEPGITLSLPKIPYQLLSSVISFFRELSGERQLEALANIYYKKESHEYIVHIPEQKLSKVSVDTENTCSEDVEGLLHVMDIHSHNTMPAKFSPTDDRDEKATRIYAVIGRLDQFFPEIKVRISNGGKFLEIPPGQVFELYEDSNPYPEEWEEKIINLKDTWSDGDDK